MTIAEEISNANITNATQIANNSTLDITLPTIEHSFLSAKTLVAIVILLIYTVSTPIFEKIKFHYIHESGICMILGLLVGVIAVLFNPNVKILCL